MASVGQAQMLANALSGFVELHRPPSLAVIGCTGGNGLERVSRTVTSRLVAVDANPVYAHVAQKQFAHRFRQFEAVVGDAQSEAMTFMPVAAAFAGLVFEYVSPSALLRQLPQWIHPGGRHHTCDWQVFPEVRRRRIVIRLAGGVRIPVLAVMMTRNTRSDCPHCDLNARPAQSCTARA
jgi:hypothetical protein